MFNDVRDILGDPTDFLDTLFMNLKKDGIDVTDFELDHICYRVEILEKYRNLWREVQEYGELLSEAMINGRPISTFKLLKPFIYCDREISCLEIPSPAEGKKYKQGFEHAEFVINKSFDDLMLLYPGIEFKTNGIHKPINADIGIKYSDGTSAKFHHHTLEYVIKYLQG